MSRSKPLQLIVALEPEAAGLYCSMKKMQEFVEDPALTTGDNQMMESGVEFVVMDAGGK